MEPSGTLAFVSGLLDPGTWRCWDDPADPPPAADPEYLATWHAARGRTGLDEAVVTGEGRMAGRRVALMACHFEFMAGSVGAVAADRLTRAAERATAERLPLLAVTRSGGTRMQEGTLAFVRMAGISAAVARHRAAGLPYLVYLRHPTTGGVLATWGSLGHLTLAEPGALVGFLGPRIHAAVHGEPFPAGVQVAENLLEHGIVDDVVPPAEVPAHLSRALDVLCAGRQRPAVVPAVPAAGAGPSPADVPAWETVERSRRPDRPGVCDLLADAASDVSRMSGTAAGERAHSMVLALARFGGVPCVVVGHDRRAEAAGHRPGPAGLRVARRGLRLAAELDLPLLTVVDTGGAALTPADEEGGLAGEIARCLAELVTLPPPTLCLMLGQGSGGAALALVPADRVVAAQHSWLAPLSPEGASAVLYRDTGHAPEMAARQGVRAVDLHRAGVVDRVVPEHPDAADERPAFLDRVSRVLVAELAGLLARDPTERAAARLDRYRRMRP